MNYRRFLPLALIILTVVGFIVLLSIGLVKAKKGETEGAVAGVQVNRQAADFTLPLFGGGNITLSNLKGKPVVLNFWASWCPPCREEAPALQKVSQVYKDKDVTFIGVDIQDREADAQAFIKEFGVTYPNGPDIGGKITIDYGVRLLPVTFFINRDGVILTRWEGAINEGLLTNKIEEMLR